MPLSVFLPQWQEKVYSDDMKVMQFVLLAVSILCIVSCSPNIDNQEDGNDMNAVSSVLSMTADAIDTISPYSYSSMTKSTDTNTYLSYTEDGKVVFRPLVFESSSGTKIVFEDADVKDLHNGFLFVSIGNLKTIRKEPVVTYVESGEVDEDGNTLFSAVEIEVDVIDEYWNNNAIINLSDNSAYLLNDPKENREDSIWFYTGDDDYAVSENYLYIIGNKSVEGNKSAELCYRIDFRNLKDGQVEQITTDSIAVVGILSVSDTMAVLELSGGPNYIYLLVDLSGDYPATFLLEDEYVFEDENGNNVSLECFHPEDEVMIAGSSIYDLDYIPSISAELSIGAFSVEEGKYRPDKATLVPRTLGGRYLRTISLFCGDTYSEGIFAELNGLNKGFVGVLRVIIENGKINVESIPLDDVDGSTEDFVVSNERLYWLSGVGNNNTGSYISYYNLETDEKRSFRIPGDSVPSSDLSVSADGTVIFTQSLGRIDRGTFKWNPEKEAEPTLLMRIEQDVHSIVDISDL